MRDQVHVLTRRFASWGKLGRVWPLSPGVSAVILTVGAVAWILSGQIGSRSESAQANQAAGAKIGAGGHTDAPAMPVQVVTARAEDREIVARLSGRTEGGRRVALRSETAGRVAAIEARKGSRIADGAIVLRLAPDDRPAQLEQARALVRRRSMEAENASTLQVRGFQSEVKVAETASLLADARAALAAIQLDLERTTVRAPFAGVVDSLDVEIGSVVAVGSSLGTLIDLDPLRLVAFAGERAIARISAGMHGIARFPDGRERTGLVTYVSASGDAATRTFRVELAIENPGGVIPEMLSAEMILPLSRVPAVKVSPAVLVLDEAGRVGVKLVDSERRVAFRPVEIVADDADGFWLAGVPDGATLIVVGQEFVKPGMVVAAVPAGQASVPPVARAPAAGAPQGQPSAR